MTSKVPSKMELAKALKQVKALSDPEDYKKISDILCPKDLVEDVEKAISGLSEEDEFILLSKLMKTVVHVSPLEQRHEKVLSSSAPDILMTFQPGFRAKGISPKSHEGYQCLVEVKTTAKNKFKMSGKALSKLRTYADTYGLPLLFAVRMKAFDTAAMWMMVEDTDRTEKSISVDFGDWVSGLRSVLWDDYCYLMLPGVHFEGVYSKTKPGVGGRHSKYGNLIGFNIVKHKERFKYKGIEALTGRLFFAPYGLKEIEVIPLGDITLVSYEHRNNMLSVADLVYGINLLPTNANGERVYDPSRVLRKMVDGEEQSLVDRDTVEISADQYLRIGVIGIIEFGETESRYQKWLLTGGKE